MKVVYLLVALLALMGCLFIIYFALQLLLKNRKSSVVRSIIEKRVDEKTCENCNLTKEEMIEKIENGEIKAGKFECIRKYELEEISKSLNEDIKNDGKEVAYVFCRGGSRVKFEYHYEGVQGCQYLNKLYSGDKTCRYACLGCMDCAKVCPTGAIFKNEYGTAEIDRSLCIGCGKCTKECPDKLIKMIPLNQKIVTACKYCLTSTHDPYINEYCAVGCSKCGECTKVCKSGALKFDDKGQLIFVNSKCTKCYECVKVCPSQTIVAIIDAIDKI